VQLPIYRFYNGTQLSVDWAFVPVRPCASEACGRLARFTQGENNEARELPHFKGRLRIVIGDGIVDLTRRIGRKFPDLRALLAGGALAQAEKIAKAPRKPISSFPR